MPTPEELLAEENAKQAAEWGQYVAILPIDIGGARAFNPGSAVPTSHVTSGVVPQESVEKVGDQPAAPAAPAPAVTPPAPVEEV